MHAMTYLSVVLGLLLALFLAPGPRPEADRAAGPRPEAARSAGQHAGEQKHGFSDYAVAW
jgi:hypothetical protein